MKLKLSYNQFDAFHRIMSTVVYTLKPSSMVEKLVYTHLVAINHKLHVRSDIRKKQYRFSLSAQEAMALYLAFKDVKHMPHTSIEGNTLNQILIPIHQKFS